MRGFRRIAVSSLYRLGLGEFLIGHHRRHRGFPVLLFHRVSPVPDPLWPPLSPQAFRELLLLFQRKYRFLPVEKLLEGKELPRDAAFISFDDAFQDFEDHALPVLSELDLPASLFVPTGSIDSGKAIWPSLVDAYLTDHWEEGEGVLEIGSERIKWGNWKEEGKGSCGVRLKQKLMSLPYAQQLEVREKLEALVPSSGIRSMSWDALKRLPSSIELGAHTVAHPYLPSVEKEEDIEREMMMSKERVEKMTGRDVKTFAYPFGGYDERCVRIASEQFELSFTSDGVLAGPLSGGLGSWRIPRIDVVDEDARESLLRVNGLHRCVRSFFGTFNRG